MKIAILASGSSGNATLFEAGGTRILVDAGISPRSLRRAMSSRCADVRVDGVVITHAHNDHVGFCARIAREYNCPLYMSEATARARSPGDDAIDLKVFSAREPFTVGALTVTPTPVPHDAAQVALRIEHGGRSAAIVTDLGEVTANLTALLAPCDVLLLESNHDPWLLDRGPYTAALKRRIRGASGHLSNEQTHALIRSLPDHAHTVALMHLSRTNNRPELALEVARDALAGRKVHLFAAAPSGAATIDTEGPRAIDPVVSAGPLKFAPVADAARPSRQLSLGL